MTDTNILVIVPFPLEEEGVERRQNQVDPDKYGETVDFVYKPVKSSCAYVDSYHDRTLLDLAVFETGIDAEEEGYDAVCIDTVSDSGMKALRSVLSIPVIGPGQTQFHIAQMLGKRFTILTQWDRWIPVYTDQAVEYGAGERLASVKSIDMSPDLDTLLDDKENVVFPRLKKKAQQAIEEDGADVICMGSTTMHQAVDFLSSELPVPVINPGPLSYKLAESFVDLGLSHSREAYPEPNMKMNNKIHKMFEAVEGEYPETE